MNTQDSKTELAEVRKTVVCLSNFDVNCFVIAAPWFIVELFFSVEARNKAGLNSRCHHVQHSYCSTITVNSCCESSETWRNQAPEDLAQNLDSFSWNERSPFDSILCWSSWIRGSEKTVYNTYTHIIRYITTRNYWETWDICWNLQDSANLTGSARLYICWWRPWRQTLKRRDQTKVLKNYWIEMDWVARCRKFGLACRQLAPTAP